MRVFALGGAGTYGRLASRMLMASELVTEITIAGRNIERAEQAAAELGHKAKAVQVDGTDEERLAALLVSHDIIVDTTGNAVYLSAVRAAISAGTHYCNLDAPRQVLELDAEARTAGIIVSVGDGAVPGLTNLMAVQAATQLDEVEVIQVGHPRVEPKLASALASLKDPRERAAALRESGHVEYWLQRIQRMRGQASRQMTLSWNGQWLDVDPRESGVEVVLPQGGAVTAYPLLSHENLYGIHTLRRHFPGVQTVGMEFSWFPPPLDHLLSQQTRRVVAGEVGSEEAAKTFHEIIAEDSDQWLGRPAFTSRLSIPAVWNTAVVATSGRKDGRAARSVCWTTTWEGMHITASLVVAARKIMRGEVEERGVLPPEACFQPLPFFDDVAHLLTEPPPNGKLIAERFEFLN